MAQAGRIAQTLERVRRGRQQFGVGADLKGRPPPWDWFFQAEPKE